VLPRRWVVERTFGRLKRVGRLSKDYEQSTSSSVTSIHTWRFASTSLVLL
jgi:transposase